uniref:Uncharacterized protein n=1 Tax=Anguilla anguilla TaxID=7936 RepID=A0A0E9XKQ4_ANGAN
MSASCGPSTRSVWPPRCPLTPLARSGRATWYVSAGGTTGRVSP